MNLKKTLLLAIIIIVSSILAAGCQSGASTFMGEPALQTAAVETIMVDFIHTAAYHTVIAGVNQTLTAIPKTETPKAETATGTGQEFLSVEQIESSGTNQAEITLTPRPNPTMDIGLEKSAIHTPSPTITISPPYTASLRSLITITTTHTRMPTYTLTATATLWPSLTRTKTPTRTSTLKPSPTYTSTHTFTPIPTKTATHTRMPTHTLTVTATLIPSPTRTFTPTNTNSPSPTRTATKTAKPTNTTTLTRTITTTRTNTPTRTASPSPTNTPLPEPLIYSGKGDFLQEVKKWEGPGFVHIKNTGKQNFILWNLDSTGNNIDLLVNSVGNYDGYLPLDFLFNKQTARFKITSDGSWTIAVYPISERYIQTIPIPGTYTSQGDDVVLVSGNPSFAQFSVPGTGAFMVWTYTMDSGMMILKEQGPFYGYVNLDKNFKIIAINSKSKWTLQVK